jgi:CMP-N,N'-diacetyllegionaminic acid synthase
LSLLGLIPARGGSKGIPRKNLAPLAGKPLIAWTAKAALAAPSLSRVVVSTDDAEIAAAARDCGVEALMRPAALATDQSGALEVIRHAIERLEAQHGKPIDAVAYLQPTSPLRTAEHIERAVALLRAQSADTVVSVVAVPHNMIPESQMTMAADARLSAPPPGQSLRRQDKPRRYARNGPAVLVVSRRCVMELGTLYGERTFGFEMRLEESLDIDSAADLELAEAWLRWRLGR